MLQTAAAGDDDMSTLFELDLVTPVAASRDVSACLHQQLRNAILQGRLRPGAKLPSTRNARHRYGVSRNAMQEVYARLADEGLVDAYHGSGTYVAHRPPEPTPVPYEPAADWTDGRLNDFWLSSDIISSIGFWRESDRRFPSGDAAIDLRPGSSDPALFPFATFRRVMARELRRLEIHPFSSHSSAWDQGSHPLRCAITNHVSLTRAIACEPDDVLVTSGAQQGFDLIARTLVKAGETIVAVEDPAFPLMRVAFAAAGARLVPVRVDSEGIVIDDIPKGVGIICVCPSHQFPLGMTMSPARREALLQFASSNGAVIVEDDYDGEFRYDGAALQALRNSASSDFVIYVGSFSKCMLPSFRLGFVILPRWARRPLVAAKNALDWQCSVPLQLAVAAFIKDGHLRRHLQRMRRIYKERRDHVLGLLDDSLSPWLRPISSSHGVHVTATVSEDLDTEAVSAALANRGIICHGLKRYFMGLPSRSGFVLSYAAADLGALSGAAAAIVEECQRALPRLT